jgi:hypothetical protein
MVDYLTVQFNSSCKSLFGISPLHTYSYTGDTYVELDNYEVFTWQAGSDELRGTFLTGDWENSHIRQSVYLILSKITSVWIGVWSATYVNAMLHACVMLGV